MNQQKILFEYSPLFLLACVALGLAYAWLLYARQHNWSKRVNQVLFVVRTVVVTILAFLLLGPILRLAHNISESPVIAIVVDNSQSVTEAVDSATRTRMNTDWQSLSSRLKKSGYEVMIRDIANHPFSEQSPPAAVSDLSEVIHGISSELDGRNLQGIILATDGIYNGGVSPLYSAIRVPIYTVGVGDTVQHADVVLSNIAYNKIAYQGNKFPVVAEVQVQDLPQKDITVTLRHGDKKLSQTINSGNNSLLRFEFLLEAKEKGLQRLDVSIQSLPSESNVRNNNGTAFVEVVEGKKKVLVIAPAPHPDIKALRSVLDKNANYEFFLHIPGVKEAPQEMLQRGKADLIIFHQALDLHGKTLSLFNQLGKGPSPVLLILCSGTNFRQLKANGIPLVFDNAGQWDEVTPLVNVSYSGFGLPENSGRVFSNYPPLTVPFGKFTFPSDASILLHQRIGSVTTDRPLMFSYEDSGRKTGVILGEGLWRWRLNEFSENEKTEIFDEVFSRFIQFLSAQEDKRKFRGFPIRHEFSGGEAAVFESQVYNDLYEQVYNQEISIELRDEKNVVTQYSYVTSPGNIRYRMGGLHEGVFRYQASTIVQEKKETVTGEFLITAQNIETKNLTADFNLLRKLASRTGGKFYSYPELSKLENQLSNADARSILHTEETFLPLIDLKWVFFLLLTLISGEWFTRKYLGSY